MMKENGLDIFIPYFNAFKYQGAFIIAYTWTTFASFFQTYIFNDWSSLIYLAIVVLIDTILGVWRAYKYNQISSAKFGGFIIKVVLYGLFLVMIHSLSNFSNADWAKYVFSYLQELCFAALLVREAISIIENIGAIKKDLIPVWILKKMKSFDETGEYKINKDA
jgi:small basic protein